MEQIIISINGGLPDEEVQFVTGGTLLKKDGKTVLEYRETELSGVEGTTTRIIVDEDEVSLQRTGTSTSFMHFVNNGHSMAEVFTPAGAATLNVYTHDFSFTQDDLGGRIDLSYTLELNGRSVENNIWVDYNRTKH